MAITNTFGTDMIWIGFGALSVAAISFLDDCLTIHSAYRLVVHASVAGMLVYTGFYLSTLELPGMVVRWPVEVGTVVSLLFIIWMINLYNFMIRDWQIKV